MDIYWIRDKRQCGPSTVPDVISLIQAGELTPDTLGWHAGCPRWVPLRELPALVDFLNRKEDTGDEGDAAEQLAPPFSSLPTIPAATTSAQPQEESLSGENTPDSPADSPALQDYVSRRVYLPSPIARLLARFVDYGLYAALYYGIINLRGVPYDAALLLTVNPLLWLPMIALEAWMLSTWGSTPGKALMGIRVTTFGDARRLSFLRAFMRALMVFTLGMGVMIPHILPLMLAFEYWMLRRRGITPWDARSSTLPTQQSPILPSRYVLAAVSIYISIVIAASCMQPWLPGMVREFEKTSPELAHTLRQYLPEETSSAANTAPATTTPAASAPAVPPASPASPASPVAPAPFDTSLPGI